MANKKNNKEKDEKNHIVKRLDIIIRLLMEEQIKNKKMKRSEQLRILDSVGLRPNEIGNIMGQKSKDISSQLVRLKKKKTKEVTDNE